MNFFDWLNPEKAGNEIGRTFTQEAQKKSNELTKSFQDQIKAEEDANKKYTADYLAQLEEPYGKAYDKNRENLISNVSQLGQERQAQQGMELGRMGLGNTVAGSLLKNKLATQQSRSLGQTLSGLDTARLQQMAGLKLMAINMAQNKVAGRVAAKNALEEEAREEAMAIPNMIGQYLGQLSQEGKQIAGSYLSSSSGGALGTSSAGKSSGFGYGQSLPTGYAYVPNPNKSGEDMLVYNGGVE